ncbi:unnamed protein product [Camellia sinensis]
MPRQNWVVEGLIPEFCKIRKRGCSSSSSSVLQNYQFKRAILVGKPLGSRSSTPVPSWRTTAAASDSRKYAPSQSGGGRSRPVSARKLVWISTFLHACEGDVVTKLTNEKIPYFDAPIYLQNKTQIGKVEEILGPINESQHFFFTAMLFVYGCILNQWLANTITSEKFFYHLDMLPILTELRHALDMQVALENHVEEGNFFKNLERVHGFTFGDSLDDSKKSKWRHFRARLNRCLDVVRTDRALVFYEKQEILSKLWDILARANFRCTESFVGVETQLNNLASVTQVIDPKLHQHLVAYFNAPGGDEPLALDMGSMGKGQVWINGQSIRRYWTAFATGNCNGHGEYGTRSLCLIKHKADAW